MSHTEDHCVACGAPLPQNVNVKVRLLNSSHLRACAACGTWSYFPRQDVREQAAIHDDESYFEHPYFELRRKLNEDQRRRIRKIFRRLDTAIDTGSLRGQRWLDVGCDTGLLLGVAAEELGVVPVGIDVAQRAVARAAEQGIEAYHTCIEQAPEGLSEFAVITAVDLIEHVTAPAAFLAQIRRRLRHGGVAYLETPNIGSSVYGAGRTLAGITSGRPADLLDRLFPPQHIQYFTLGSLSQLAQASGLEVVRIDTRVLPSTDIAASLPIRAAMTALQLIDRFTNNRILIWAVLRRPTER